MTATTRTNETFGAYGQGTNVLCEACRRRTIFVKSPIQIVLYGGRRYMNLKCPSPSCGQVLLYEEDELEIHGFTFRS